MDDPGVGGLESAAIEPQGPSAEGAPPESPSGLGPHDHMLSGTAGEDLAMAPNGERVATYSSAIDGDGGPAPRIRVWSGAGELLSEIQQQIPVKEIVFSPDGSLLASVEPTRIRVFDTGSGSLLHEFPAEAVAFSPNGKTIVISGRGFVNLYDAVSGGEPQKLDIEPLIPSDVESYPYFIIFDNLAFSPDATFLSFEYYQTGSVDRGKVTRSERPNHRIQTWSFFDNEFLARSYSLGDCGGSCDIRALRFFERLLVLNNGDREVFVFDRETGKAVSTLSGRLVLLARHGENPAAMVAERDHVRIYDLVTGDLVQDVVSLELASARVSDDLRLGARRGPNGSWLIFPAQGGAMAAE
jgi:WD40 repeat protein